MSTRAKEKGLVGQSAVFYVSIYIFAFFKFLGGFFVARILGPALYGLRNVFGLVTEFEYFMHLGTYDAVQREVPFHRGRGEHAAADKILSTAFSINMVYASVVGVALLATAAILSWRGEEAIWVDFFIFLSAWILIGKIAEYFHTFLITEKDTSVLSIVNAVHGFLTGVLGVGFTYQFGLRGLFVALIIAETVRACWFTLRSKQMPSFVIEKATLFRLYKVGFPIMMIAMLFVLLRSIDRVIIAAFLPDEMLGFFGVGTIVSGLIYLSVGDLTRTMLFPRLMERLGESEDPEHIRPFLVQPATLVAYLVPFVIGGIYLTIPLPIRYVLPEFTPAIQASQLLLVGSFFFSVVTIPILVCVALGKQLRVVALAMGAILLNAALSVGFIKFGHGINGVAIGTGISYWVFCTVTLAYTLTQFRVAVGEQIALMLRINLPFIYSTGLLLAVGHFIGLGDSFVDDLLRTTLRVVIYLAAFAVTTLLMRNDPAFKALWSGLPARFGGQKPSAD